MLFLKPFATSTVKPILFLLMLRHLGDLLEPLGYLWGPLRGLVGASGAGQVDYHKPQYHLKIAQDRSKIACRGAQNLPMDPQKHFYLDRSFLSHKLLMLRHLGVLLGPLGDSWGPLVASWGILRASWQPLGGFWGSLGAILGLLGILLGPLRGLRGLRPCI